MLVACERLQQFLAEREHLLLAWLGELDEEIGRRREEHAAHLGEEISQLSALISELEERCWQPALELLQGVRSAESRGKEATSLHLALKCPELEQRIWDFPGENSLQRAVMGFLDSGPESQLPGLDVTLDPDTAHPKLILSEDQKRVRCGDTRHVVPDTPGRFDPCACVLGAEGYAGGRHYWEVEVGDKPRWTLGVCRESVNRKESVTLSPEDGHWAVWLRNGEYEALTCPFTPLPVSARPSQVGIFLDYEAGEVLFYNATDKSYLFTFTDSFSGTLRPYFYPGHNAQGRNAAPLTICPVLGEAEGILCP
uniref:B30.2/SPRY domain-containing protein n=1 Tax=Pelodiscus sinensis TaxID=13735 RepID=K7FT96_PELSI